MNGFTTHESAAIERIEVFLESMELGLVLGLNEKDENEGQ